MRWIRTFIAVLCCSTLGYAADPLLSEIQLRTDPEDARIRPFETLVVQVLAYGELTDAEEQTKKVRLRKGAPNLSIKGSDAGWLSKSFRYQGEEGERFYQQEGAGLGAIIFGRAQSDFNLKDSVLYTAPAKAGSYEIEAEIDGKTASMTVTVDPNAPSRRPSEKTKFPKERPSRDPYRRLAEHYAPFVAQETWFQPKSDFLARFDLDGDWRGDNNWDTAEAGSSQAYVYYAAMETDTHWFLIYNFFHPRDYSDKCVAGTCHENDNEGAVLTVEKEGSQYGRLIIIETLAHNNVYSYRADRRIKKNVHSPDGKIETYEHSHPVVFIEAGGHGVYGSNDSHSRYSISQDQFSAGTGVTYVYQGVAERPRHGNDRKVGYELLSIYDHWWSRAHEGRGRQDRTFDGYYAYQPYGGRPRSPYPELAGSFLGRKFGSNKAKPFWGWHDRRTRKKKVLATGQWALDPAYAVSRDLKIPGPFSLDYVFNPYLGIGKPRAQTPSAAWREPIPSKIPPPSDDGRQKPIAPKPPQPAGESPAKEVVVSSLQELPSEPSSDFDSKANNGQFDLRMKVDGTVEVFIQGELLRYHVIDGKPPVDSGSDYTQPVPRATFRKFELQHKDGRGDVRLLESPSESNDFTVRLKISDPKGGADRYHARLRWEWDELVPETPPAPSRSRILSKHLENIRLVEDVAEEGESSGDSTQGALPPDPPGDELRSNDNDPRRYNRKKEGRFEFRGRIDGTVVFRIRGDRVFAEITSGRPVEVDRFSFSQPLPAATLGHVEVDKEDGRGKIVVLKRPSEGNNFTAVLQVSDPKRSDDRYHFRLNWKR